jgi:hypothetical protein
MAFPSRRLLRCLVSPTMEDVKLRKSVRWLISRAVKLTKARKRRCTPGLRYQQSALKSPIALRADQTAVMADGEEDFSSLPLPDRFTHKVGQES